MTTQAIEKPRLSEQAVQRSRALATQRVVQAIGPRIILIIMAIIYLVPLYWMFVTALKPATELSAFPPTFWPQDVRWDNFAKAVSYIPFWSYFLNTTIITVANVIGAVLANLVVAYGFSCITWPGRDRVFFLVLATIFIPFPITIIPLFDLFAHLQWINTYLPLIVPTFFGSAFYVFMLRQFMLQIPRDLLEAARIDGASEWQILRQVVTPMVAPTLAVVAIFTFVASWKDFLGPLIYLQDDSVRTLSVGLQVFRSTHDIQFNLLMAASTLIVLPEIIIFLAFQRFFIRGLTIGAIR